MSEDICKIFCSISEESSIDEIKKEIATLYEGDDQVYCEISSFNREGSDRGTVIQIEYCEPEIANKALKVVADKHSKPKPYAYYFMEQTGDGCYLGLIEGKVEEFEGVDDIEISYNQQSEDSLEDEFFSSFQDASYLLLLRLKVPGKKVRTSFNEVCNNYIKSKSEADFDLLKQYIDGLDTAEEFVDENRNFPHVTDEKDNSFPSNIKIAKSLCFSQFDEKFIFLGFNSDSLSYSILKHPNQRYSQVCTLIHSFLYCKPIKRWQGKLRSKEDASELESSFFYSSSAGCVFSSNHESPKKPTYWFS